MDAWKSVVGYEGFYEVSSCGEIRRPMYYVVKWPATNGFAGQKLKPALSRDGYRYVYLSKNGKAKGFKIHRLVALAFLGSCPIRNEVNHIDGNKENNRVGNLEFVSHAENMSHAIRSGLLNTQRDACAGENHWNAKLTPMAIRVIKRLKGKLSRKDTANLFNVCSATISRVQHSQSWKVV